MKGENMKRISFMAILFSCLLLHITKADEMLEVASVPVEVKTSMDIYNRVSKLHDQKKALALSKRKRALADLLDEAAEVQELANIQNQFVSELRAFSLDLKQGMSVQAIRDFKSKNFAIVEEVFGKKEASLFKKVCDLLADQPYDVQSSLIGASIKSLGYPSHGVTKDLRQKQKKAKLMAQEFPEMESQVAFV